MQEVVYQVWLAKGRALVSITGGDDPCGSGGTCEVVPVVKAGRFTGKILDGGKRAGAFVMTRSDCGPEECASILALHRPDKDDQIIDAISVPGGCEPTLSTLRVAPDHDSLSLLCSASAGAGDIQQRLVYHVVDGKLTQQLSFDAGHTELATRDEKASGACTTRPIGAAEIVKGDDGPRLRITRAPDDGQATAGGQGPSCRRQMGIEQDYRWDVAQKALVTDGPGRPVVKDRCDCKH